VVLRCFPEQRGEVLVVLRCFPAVKEVNCLFALWDPKKTKNPAFRLAQEEVLVGLH
jgi:hypothetical protein